MFLVYCMYAILISSLNFFLPFLPWSNCCWFLFLLLNVDILLCFSNPPVYLVDHKSTYTFIIASNLNHCKLLSYTNLLACPSFTPHPIYYFIVYLQPCFPWISHPFLNPALSEITHTFNYSFLNSWIFLMMVIQHFNHLPFRSNTHYFSFIFSYPVLWFAMNLLLAYFWVVSSNKHQGWNTLLIFSYLKCILNTDMNIYVYACVYVCVCVCIYIYKINKLSGKKSSHFNIMRTVCTTSM